MNKVLFFGLGVPRQVAPLDNVSYNKNWGQYYAKYDTAQANKLLDEIGLNKKDSDGFRLRKDGKPVQMIIEYGDPNLSTGFELIKEYWEAIGVKTVIKLEDWGLIEQRMFASEHDAVQDGFAQGGDERTLYGMAWHWDTAATRKWEVWASSMQTAWRAEVGKGNPIPTDYLRRAPKDTSTITGEKPPEMYIAYIEARNKISSLELGTAEYAATGQKIFDTYVTQLWNIGTVGMAPTPLIVKNNIGNVPDPKNYIKGQRLADPLVAHFADQLYFK
jgi:peptide/nickel transport system substrate-binding protein